MTTTFRSPAPVWNRATRDVKNAPLPATRATAGMATASLGGVKTRKSRPWMLKPSLSLPGLPLLSQVTSSFPFGASTAAGKS